MSKSHYRADIDGLRAIAVLSVILFHANPSWLPSGFLGVDIFFVISGFLITGIIHRELQDGTFSWLYFYQRRAKRILPVFLLVLCCAIFAAAYLMLPNDFFNMLKSAQYSLLFAANLYFGKQGGYFDTSSTEKPLQHIWSLSVEEQFYFIFPIFLWLLHQTFKKNTANKTLLILPILMILSAASFYFHYEKYDAYFLPWARAYELLIGAWFSIYQSTNQTHHTKTVFSYICACIVLITLAIPHTWWIDQHTLPRILICLATGYLLFSGSRKQTRIHQYFSLPILVRIGLLSYSLYLWHWVIFALMRYVYMNPDLPFNAIMLAILLTFILSYCSFQWVEQPARCIQLDKKQFAAAMLIYACFTISINLTYSWYNYNILTPYQEVINSQPFFRLKKRELCYPKKPQSCIFGKRNVPTTVLAIGDSHTRHYTPFYDEIGKHEGWAVHIEGYVGCLISPYEQLKTNKFCTKFQNRLPYLIQQHQTIIWAQRWSHYGANLPNDVSATFAKTTSPNFLVEFEKTLQWLLQQGKTVYIMSDNPNTGYISPFRKQFLENHGFNLAIPRQYNIDLTTEMNQKLKSIVAKYPQAYWVELDFKRYLPHDYQVNGSPLYYDDDHFNPYGSRYLAQQFIQDKQKLIHETITYQD